MGNKRSKCAKDSAGEKEEDVEVPREGSESPKIKRKIFRRKYAETIDNLIQNKAQSSNKELEWSGEWSFCQLADTQFGMHDKVDWENEMNTVRAAVNAINALRPKPRFVIVCGDLVDAWPNGPRANLEDHEKQKQDFKLVMDGVSEDIPLVCVCGNHDVGNRVTKRSIDMWKRSFGPDYAAFSIGGCRCILLNSSLLDAKNPNLWSSSQEEATPTEEEKSPVRAQQKYALELADKQDRWLEKEIKAMKAKQPTHVMVFSHIPPFIYRPEEPEGYFNLSPKIRTDVIRKVKDAGATKWFCGHFHRNAGGSDGSLEVVITRAAGCVLPYVERALKDSSDAEALALGLKGFDFSKRLTNLKVSGFRLVCVRKREIAHRFVTMKTLGDAIKSGTTSVSSIVGAGESDGVTRRDENRSIFAKKASSRSV